MPKRNRAYKKGEVHRDAQLFVIVAEGEREDAYFEWFHERNQRISVKIVPREQDKSAPNHFLNRLQKFIQDEEWLMKPEDKLWFVLDVDRWKRKEIESLIHSCEQNPQWHIGISNPCFEVWILFHIEANIQDTKSNCKDLKQSLHHKIQGGFHIEKICPLLLTAVEKAKNADLPGTYPDIMRTKLYLLGEQMLAFLGKNWN